MFRLYVALDEMPLRFVDAYLGPGLGLGLPDAPQGRIRGVSHVQRCVLQPFVLHRIVDAVRGRLRFGRLRRWLDIGRRC